MRAVVGVALLVLLGGCAGDDPQPEAAPETQAVSEAPTEVARPEWDPRDVDELPMVTTGFPDVVETPKTAPALADHPVKAAVLAGRREDAVLLLVPDGSWRSVPTSSAYGAAELTADGTRLAVEEDYGVEVWDLAAGERTRIPVPDGFRDWDYVDWDWLDSTTLLLDDLNPGGWRVDTATGAAKRTPYPANKSVWRTVDTDGAVVESREYPRSPMLTDWAAGEPRQVDLAKVGRLFSLRADQETVVGTAYQNGPFSVYVVDRSDATVRAALPIRDTDGNYSGGGLGVVALQPDGTVLMRVSVFGKHPSWRVVAWDPHSGELQRVARGVGEVSSYARDLLGVYAP